jgi:hypothetical protein
MNSRLLVVTRKGHAAGAMREIVGPGCADGFPNQRRYDLVQSFNPKLLDRIEAWIASADGISEAEGLPPHFLALRKKSSITNMAGTNRGPSSGLKPR